MMQPHVMIVTPAQNGLVHIPYMLSFAGTQAYLAQNGVKVSHAISKSGSLLAAERNRLMQAFWESDATHVLCIDADLGWPPEAVLAMLRTGKEFIAGCYPARGEEKTFLFRPDFNPDDSLKTDNHLIKMTHVPAGFMLISREAIRKIRDANPELYYSPKDPRNPTETAYCLFNCEVFEGEFWGEDYFFCRKATDAGVEIWVDPLIQFDHAGTIGTMIDCLRTKEGGKIVPQYQQTQSIAA